MDSVEIYFFKQYKIKNINEHMSLNKFFFIEDLPFQVGIILVPLIHVYVIFTDASIGEKMKRLCPHQNEVNLQYPIYS